MKDYDHINSFLDKFKKILFSKEEIKKNINQAIFEIIDKEIEQENIKIKNNIIKIDGSPSLKNEIFIFKQKILSKINEKTKERQFLDIV
jgi:hypothetical protein